MNRALCLVSAILIFRCLSLAGQDRPPSDSSQDQAADGASNSGAEDGTVTSGFEILSETNSEDLGHYQDQLLAAVRGKWHLLISRLDVSPEDKRRETVIEFMVRRDGSLGKMKVVGTSGKPSLDAAASDGIKSAAPFAPLPLGYRNKGLSLRFHFGYNQPPSPERPACGPARPGVFRAGGQVKMPRVLFQPDPEFSEEARKAKYQGFAVLRLTVGIDGLPADICVAEASGRGLDEKAVEAVKLWRFEPGTKDDLPVPTQISVEASFHLY